MQNSRILSLAASAAIFSVLFTACSSTGTPAPQKSSDVKYDIFFQPASVPMTDADKKKITTAPSVTVNGKNQPIAFHTIARTGDKLPSLDGKSTEIFGQVKNQAGQPIQHKDGSNFICRTSKDGSGPDHTTLHEKDGNLFAITQFECGPGAMYISKLEKTKEGGLKAVATDHISQASENGGWVHCAGMVTPWGSHLGSEEYEPDAAALDSNNMINDEDGYYNNFSLYFKDGYKALNPYFWGWTPEVTIKNAKGDVEYTKHYSMGRFAHELAYVMPDEKTVYLSDDGTNGGLYMFVAKEKGNLSEGTLYAAKFVQKDDNNGGAFDLQWMNMGTAKDADIKKFIAKNPKFDDLFDSAKPVDGQCPSGYGSVNTTWGHECLSVKPGMSVVASRLESRRYAALKGATTELRKEEGITFDKKRSNLYIAISRIQYGMEDFKKKGKDNPKYDIGGSNDIKLKRNDCGGVYKLNISGGAKDNKGVAIESDMVAMNMMGELLGTMGKYPAGSGLEANKCLVTGLAEPDNLTYIDGSDILIIGEDTGAHQIDYIWAYNVVTKDLTRILTSPYGSETTSPFWYPNIGGNGYLTTVIQHPFGESDQDKAGNEHDKESWVGVVGPFPAMDK